MLENLFVCIGAQKAGTKWLTSVLKTDHSFAICPFVGEVHYFDLIHRGSPLLNRWRAEVFLQRSRQRPKLATHSLARHLEREEIGTPRTALTDILPGVETRKFEQLLAPVNDDWYCNLLRPDQLDGWSVDITPDYAIIGEAGFRHMRSLAKNLRILFILREPVERSWSGFLQGKKRFPGGLTAFAESGLDDVGSIATACTVGADVGARSNYEATLDALESAGLRDEVLVKFYDELRHDPRRFMEDIYAHLGQQIPFADETFISALEKRVHVTEGKIEIPEGVKALLEEFYRPRIGSLSKRLPVPLSWQNQTDSSAA